MDDLKLGDQYKPIEVYFQSEDGTRVHRQREPRERRISNQTLPYLAFQLYEQQIKNLSTDERLEFPVFQESPGSAVYKGIYFSEKEYQRLTGYSSFATLVFRRANGGKFVIHCWNIFSTIQFVQECLRRFGSHGDSFVLRYRDKGEFDLEDEELAVLDEEIERVETVSYQNKYSQTLLESKNIIFRGSPGTGKTYLARQIAADIVSGGSTQKFADLDENQKQQVGFVQFHPSYDYSDFVEGLRPRINDDGTMGFELQDGIFKEFTEEARRNYVDSRKTNEQITRENAVREAVEDFFASIELGVTPFNTKNGNQFFVSRVEDKRAFVSIPGNQVTSKLVIDIPDIETVLIDADELRQVKDLRKLLGTVNNKQEYSYVYALAEQIGKTIKAVNERPTDTVDRKNFVFIIDEINRGEMSKIFGELFFAIDPGYRGPSGEVATQYSNLHSDPTKKFYIPPNVYVSGTMNDIDRSVDSFDFAMRRRFRFIQLRAKDQLGMLTNLGDEILQKRAEEKMTRLNNAIAEVDDLNENYEIGPAYFLKLNSIGFNQLWTDYLEPLLREYVQGLYGEAEIMRDFEAAYGYPEPEESNASAYTQSE